MRKIIQTRYNSPVMVCLPAFLLFTMNGIWATASAYDWERDYSVSSTLTRDDNVRLSEDDSVSATSVNVGVTASLQGSTETSSIQVTGGASKTTYDESSVGDNENYFLSMAGVKGGELWSGTLDLGYQYQPTIDTELEDSGNLKDGQRTTVSAAPGISYQVSERNSVYSGLDVTDVTYSTDSFTEYTDTTVSAGWRHSLSEISVISLNGSVSEYDPDDDDVTTVISVNLGYDFSTSDVTQYSLSLGYSDVDAPTSSDSNANALFEVGHKYDERNDFSLSMSSGYVASGTGQVRYENRLNLGWNHALTEKMQFSLSAEGGKSDNFSQDDSSNNSSQSDDYDDRKYINVVAGGRHQYTREVSFGANIRYRAERSDSNDADSTSVSLSLYYSPI